MASVRNREEVVNTQLAILISSTGVVADAETIDLRGDRPDVLFTLRGLRAIIEGKLEDVPGADDVVLRDARKRVADGLAHIAVAVVYPKVLRTTPTAQILKVLTSARLKYRIVAETHESEDWYEGSPISLMESLRRAHDSLIKDDIVELTAKNLSVRLQRITALWIGQRELATACQRFSD